MTKLSMAEAMQVQFGIKTLALQVLPKKRRDYSGDTDPFANFRKIEQIQEHGLENLQMSAEIGALIRLLDKLSRIEVLSGKVDASGQVNDESIADTLADAVNYICIIGCLLAERFPELKKMLIDVAQDGEALHDAVSDCQGTYQEKEPKKAHWGPTNHQPEGYMLYVEDDKSPFLNINLDLPSDDTPRDTKPITITMKRPGFKE